MHRPPRPVRPAGCNPCAVAPQGDTAVPYLAAPVLPFVGPLLACGADEARVLDPARWPIVTRIYGPFFQEPHRRLSEPAGPGNFSRSSARERSVQKTKRTKSRIAKINLSDASLLDGCENRYQA